MARALVVKQFHFEAAHSLPGHLAPDGTQGKCARLHGHSYMIEVGVHGIVQPHETVQRSDDGFVMDFSELGGFVRTLIIERLDHRHLNELFLFRTTAENLALYAFGVLARSCNFLNAHLEFVRIWEVRDSSYAEVSRADYDSDEWKRLCSGFAEETKRVEYA